MPKVLKLVSKLRKDQDGAILIEYSVLFGMVTVGVMATIVFVAKWMHDAWTVVQVQLL